MVLDRFCQEWHSTYCVGVTGYGGSSYWYASNELYVPVCFIIQ